ncbi:MAG: YceI family protein [Myxococcaceae bacterium]
MTWKIDTTHSSITFSVRHMMFAKVRGSFQKWQGELELDESLTAGKVKVQIEASSIDTGVEQRDNHLRSPDFFDVAKYPSLSFESRKVTAKGKDRFTIEGDLTLHGISKPVTLEVENLGNGKDPWGNQRVGFLATARIDRREFGLGWNQALEAGGVLVSENIDIEINVQAVSDSAQAKKAS